MFKIRRPPLRSTFMWGIALPGLLALNLHRDMVAYELKSVEWKRIELQTLEPTIIAVGTIEASRVEEIKAPINGVVEKLAVRTDAVVKRGGLIAQFSRNAGIKMIEQKKNERTDVETDLARARRKLDQQRKLNRTNAAKAQIEDTKKAIENHKEKIDRIDREIGSLRERLAAMGIDSPLSGVVLSVSVEQGQWVRAGDIMAVVADTSKYVARCQVDAAKARQLKVGQAVDIKLPSAPDAMLRGTIMSLAPQEGSRIGVLIDVQTKSPALVHGARAAITIHLNPIKETIVIPSTAVNHTAEGGTSVSVASKWGWSVRKKVAVGETGSGWVQVVKGLEPGEMIRIGSTASTAAGADATLAGGDSNSIVANSDSK